MDKSRKLRRYRRKDYTQVVEFPVEIIGRDGVVRRYPFEEAVRLYQRRYASADVRYPEPDVARAERGHCQRRIEQLRQSYFARFGWPSVEVVDGPQDAATGMAGEAAAFLRRCLGDHYPELHRFVISLLEKRDDHQVFFVVPPTTDDAEVDAPMGHFLLYTYRFTDAEGERRRDAFFEFIKVLDGLRANGGGDLEVLIAFHHTSDCGLALTASRDVSIEAVGEIQVDDLELSWTNEEPEQPDRLEEALVLVRRGLFEEALDRFVSAYTEQHYQRVAYLGATVIGDLLGRDEEATTAAIMGTRYFPGDPALQYHLALNHLRLADHKAATLALQGIGRWPQGEACVALLASLIEMESGDINLGAQRMREIDPAMFRTDTHLKRARKWLLANLSAMRILRLTALGGSVLSLGYGLLAWLSGLTAVGISGLGLGLLCLVMRTGVRRAWKRQLSVHLRGSVGRRMNLTSTSVLSRGADDAATQ